MWQRRILQVRAGAVENSSRRLSRWESPRGVMALLVLLFLLAFGLRLYRLGYQSLWYDEAVSMHLAMKDLCGLTLHTAGDIHPPLYYYLLHFWILVTGSSEFSVAFFAVVFGLLVLTLAYRLAREVYGRRVGVLTAFLIAISPLNLWYSQEVRMYTLGAFLGLITLYCLLRLLGLSRPPDRHSPVERQSEADGTGPAWRFWIGYVLAAAAGTLHRDLPQESSSRSALASLRSRVSKPSLNQS